MTEIATLLTVSLTVLAPIVVLFATPFAVAWLASKMCDCGRTA